MTGLELQAALTIIEFILKFGVPTALSIIKTIEGDAPTLEDIIALKDKVKRPEEYFDDVV